MIKDRRQWLKASGLTLLGSGFLARVDKVAATQPSTSLHSLLTTQGKAGTSSRLLLGPTSGEEGPPEPAKADRLPLEWNKAVVGRFKEALQKDDIQAFLLRDQLNIIYLTGYWHTKTERPQAVFMNKDDADPWYFYPGLDRDLVTTWWFGSGRMYFDMEHGEGAFPHEGKVQMGERTDLFRFLLEGVKEKGVQGTRIGVDGELYPSQIEKAKSILRGVEFVDVSETLMKMREVKTPEELALWRRAYTYMDRAHAFARDYILAHGTDVTDYEVSAATTYWINDILYSDLDLAGGKAHHGVASSVDVEVRAGAVTAYPHPNQPWFNRIGRNMALQVSGGCSIGGYGGENYRAFILADNAGNYDVVGYFGGRGPISTYYHMVTMVAHSPAGGSGSNIQDSVMDAASAKMMSLVLVDPQAAMATFKDSMKYVLDQAYVISRPMYPLTNFWWPWVKNYTGEYSVGYVEYDSWSKWAWIDQNLKRSMGH